MENHGIIIRHLRTLRGLDVRTTAKLIGRSTGWISEIENNTGTARITEKEFNRIVELLEGDKHRSMFKTWVANFRNAEKANRTFDGAVLRYIRTKLDIPLEKASRLTGFSVGFLSKLERGKKPIHLSTRDSIMISYGYKPSSFKNLSTDPVRSRAVPIRFKLEIILSQMSDAHLAQLFSIACRLQGECCRSIGGDSHGTT